MPARYIVRASTEFSAAHVLYGYEGACNRIHGHNFTVEVEVEARALDGVGMAIDFTQLESLTASIAQDLDHRLLNEIPPFNEVNPTAENLGAYFWTRTAKALSDGSEADKARGVRLLSVTVRENDRTSVTYTELAERLT
ncbi:MAG: 6-carboxytetrahydropterin synthase QueD [Nannocystaceae bacterium]|nr:6-carboxytetrahydropterin synthase QueD [bacterium]